MTVYFHENDIPNDIQLEGSVAIDTETMGLRTNRDRLCLIQISSGNGDAHLLKIENNDLNRFKLNRKLVIKYFQELDDLNKDKFNEFEDYFINFHDFCFELPLDNMIREAINFR